VAYFFAGIWYIFRVALTASGICACNSSMIASNSLCKPYRSILSFSVDIFAPPVFLIGLIVLLIIKRKPGLPLIGLPGRVLNLLHLNFMYLHMS